MTTIEEIAKRLNATLASLEEAKNTAKGLAASQYEALGWAFFEGEYTPAYEKWVSGPSPRYISPELAAALEPFYPSPEEEERFYNVHAAAWARWEETLTEEEEEQWEEHWVAFP